jgi:hypothetical protein
MILVKISSITPVLYPLRDMLIFNFLYTIEKNLNDCQKKPYDFQSDKRILSLVAGAVSSVH